MTSGTLFEISDPTQLDADKLLRTVSAHGYGIVRGLFSKDEMRRALGGIHAGFDAGRDRPGTSGKPGDVMDNFQKLVIGTGAQANYYIPRFVRVLYNPIWAEDIYGMRAIFKQLARLRNHVQGHPPEYAVDGIEQNLWTAARLQHYPCGGGFFAPHRDVISPTMAKESGLLHFIQILLLITGRGVDYAQGGAFIDTDAGRIDLEVLAGAGDVLVYDGRSLHGVADIDPYRLADLKSPHGRIVAMVTLYADMSGDEVKYRDYRKRGFTTKPLPGCKQ